MGLRDTDADWVKLAEENPFWAVLSREEFRGADLPKEKVRAFFDTGKKQIAATFGFVKKYLQPEFQPARCLDFGCGVGRLLIPMARMCEEAVGVDVAPEMLRLCEQFCAEECITNVRLVNSDDQLTGITEDFDFVNTLIVLQHIPPERGYSLIARLIALLKIGGVGALQLTYAKSRRFLVHEGRQALYYRREGSTIHDVASVLEGPPVGTITMFDYDLNNVSAILSRFAGHPILMLPTNDDDHLGVQFVFERAR